MTPLNMDISKRVVIDTNQVDWVSSPSGGVLRKSLVREHEESGITTSLVQYKSGSHFPPHIHPRGEEILVVDGIFSDENGDYPAGTYLRNPPGSSHSPFSKEGCLLFVKLDQFADGDDTETRVDTARTAWQPGIGGLEVMSLHEFRHEHVALVHWPAGEKFQPHRHFGGEEIYVISGTFIDEFGRYPAGTWIRNPHRSEHFPYVEEDTVIWVKTGHLLID